MATQERLSPELRDLALEDAVRAAKQNIAYWDGELSRRIGAAQAFDGMGGWLSKLMGSYDDDVDNAVREVAVARAQLAHAHQQLEEAEQALRSFREGRAREADEAVERVMQVEEAVARAKAAGGPVAEAVATVEARLLTAEARRDRLQAAHEAALGLVMELSKARTLTTQSKPQRITRYVGYGGRNYAPAAAAAVRTTVGEFQHVELATIADLAMAWEDAMLALGVDAPPQIDVAMQVLLRVDGHYTDPDRCELNVMAAQSAVEPMVRRLKGVLDEAQRQVDALMEERARVVGLELPTGG